MNRRLLWNYFTLLSLICFANILQANDTKQECLRSCLNLLKQIKQLKQLNQLGVLGEHPDVIVKESKYILSKLDEFYKEAHDGEEPAAEFSVDFYDAEDEVTIGKDLNNEDINANLLHEVESITLMTKELMQRMNEIKFPKQSDLIRTTGSD